MKARGKGPEASGESDQQNLTLTRSFFYSLLPLANRHFFWNFSINVRQWV